ncbi:MAG: YraN family protein [Chloroflexota bacterium]
MTDVRHEIGRHGEDIAARYLQESGYRLIQRNYRCSLGELDLVAEDGDDLVFVEVRTKQQPCLFRPEETVSRHKSTRLIRLGEQYLASKNQQRPWRIDVIAVELDRQGKLARIEHFIDATSGVVTA